MILKVIHRHIVNVLFLSQEICSGMRAGLPACIQLCQYCLWMMGLQEHPEVKSTGQEKTGKALLILNLSILEVGTYILFLDALNILSPCWNAIHNAAMLTLLKADSCHCKGLRHPVLATLPLWRTHPGHRGKPYQTLTPLASLPWMPQPLELKEWIYHLSLTHCKVCVGAAGRDMRQHWQYYSNQSW